MKYNKMYFHDFIIRNTTGSKTLVDLGAGLFERLFWSQAPVMAGIEICQAYVDNARFHNCLQICGDLMDYRELLKDFEFDTVLMMDVLEHLTMEDGLKLMGWLKEDFQKIIIIMPCGVYPQDQDLWGHGNDKYQKHLSSWHEEDFEKLDFGVSIIDKTFHSTPERIAKGEDVAAFFGVWEKTK